MDNDTREFQEGVIRSLKEMADRTRRTETKVSKIGNQMGIDSVTGDRPVWVSDRGEIEVPSSAVSLKEMLAVIPSRYINEIDVYVRSSDGKRDWLVTIASG